MAEKNQDQCPDCGALLARRPKHRGWHKEQDRQARSLEGRIDVLDALVLRLGGVDPAQLAANVQLERHTRRPPMVRTGVDAGDRAEASYVDAGDRAEASYVDDAHVRAARATSRRLKLDTPPLAVEN